MDKRKRKTKRRAYANRNKAWNTRQNTVSLTLGLSAAIVMVVLIGLVWLCMRQGKDSLYDEIKLEENRNSTLVEALNRETVKWNNAKTPARITTALARHGIRMDLPRRSQYVSVRSLRVSGPAAAAPTAWAANL